MRITFVMFFQRKLFKQYKVSFPEMKHQKKIVMVNSIDDLTHYRSRRIAYRFGLQVKEIIPRYLRADDALRSSGLKLETDLKPDIPLDSLDEPMRDIASSAILAYERSKADELILPCEPYKIILPTKGPKLLHLLSGLVYEFVTYLMDKVQESRIEMLIVKEEKT